MIFKRSMVSELANSAGGIFTVLFTIVLTVGMVRILGMAAGGRIDNATVLQMVVYNSLTNLPPLLALSLFIAVLMTMMRWWQDNEMVVWFSAGGRSLFAWIIPVLRFAVPLIIAIGVLSLFVSPWSKAQVEISRTEFAQRDDVNRIAPGRFIETQGGQRVFFIDSVAPNGNEVGKVFMAESRADKETTVTASRGTIEINKEGDRYLVLHDGRRYETMKNSAQTRVVEFESYSVRLDIKIDGPMSASRVSALPLSVLLATLTPQSKAELLWRITWPLVALNLTLLAIPLSCTSPRAGRALNLVLAVLLFILYLNGISVAQTWVEQEKIGLIQGLLLLNGTAFLLCISLFIRRVYMMRWLPRWTSFWYWRDRADAKKGVR